MKPYYRFCYFLLLAVPALAQQPAAKRDTLAVTIADTAAQQAFNRLMGPAEGVPSFFVFTYRFNNGDYAVNDPSFPLRHSPDTFVRQVFERSIKQQRLARVARLVTVVPLAVFAYSAVRLAMAPLALLSSKSAGSPEGLSTTMLISGIFSGAGIVATVTFDAASMWSILAGVKRHNKQFGRRLPTLFNPRGL